MFSSRDDEWVESANTGGSLVDLSAYFLTDADSVRRYAFTGTLAPGELRWSERQDVVRLGARDRLLRGRAVARQQRRLGAARQRVGADSVLVDAYTYRSHEAAADRAIGRDLVSGEWRLFDAQPVHRHAHSGRAITATPTPAPPTPAAGRR